MLRGAAALGLFLAALSLPGSASACSVPPGFVPPPNTDYTLEDPYVIGNIVVGALDLGFAIMDGVIGEQGRLLPPELAWVQLVWGVTQIAGAGVLGLFGGAPVLTAYVFLASLQAEGPEELFLGKERAQRA